MHRLRSRRLPAWLVRLALGLMLTLGLGACSLDPEGADHEIVRIPALGPASGDGPMVRMNAKELPDAPVVHKQIKDEYYSCAGLVSEWFLKLVVAEMNFLARHEGLDRVDGSACAVSRGLVGIDSGRIKIHLFRDATDANECIFHRRCSIARNVTLIPTQAAILRSYFLSDLTRSEYIRHCLAPPDFWHKAVSCEYIGKAAALGLKPDGS
jgi:hypothetical protein